MLASPFRLKVQRIEQTCVFELSWGQGQQLMATMNYPMGLTELHQEWQRVYLSFYKTAQMPLAPITQPEFPLRGWMMGGGYLRPDSVDWHAKLLEAETRLLQEFHRWLRSAELFEIRSTIAHASRRAAADQVNGGMGINVFLTCTPTDLARLPWEAWEIGADFATTGAIRLVRTPAMIRTETTARPERSRRSRARILAILGDDTGLNFQTDREAVRSLARVAEVVFVGWQPEQTAVQVKEQISHAIADAQGWDILFFAGHSNETSITGGELAIAPGVSMSIHEIVPQLSVAKQRGLQVAIFNSCNGLSIAESLIGLGFSQVVVMREPIHNCVAQEFLVQFLRHLAAHKDVHEALLAACQFLRFEKNLTYPSAYLVPCLFCHPGASLFRIPASGWQQLRSLVPTRLEAIALTLSVGLSLLAPVQQGLIDARIAMQAVYRHVTAQLPTPAPPPVTLIQIDTESIHRDGIARTHPIDRAYLARVVNQLTRLNASIVGIDVVLDTPQPGDDRLGRAIQTAVAQRQTWFVFAAILDQGRELGVSEATQIANPVWSLQGYIDADPQYVMLPLTDSDCRQTCPFAYMLALIHAQRDSPRSLLPNVHADRHLPLRSQLLDRLAVDASPPIAQLWQTRLSWISYWAYEMTGLHWLEPVVDFSIPIDRVANRIPAWQLLHDPQSIANPAFEQQIVMIVAGDDQRLAIAPGEPDRIPAPPAFRYWQPQQYWLTGGESLAYMVHHLLTPRLVLPIPDLWMIGLAAVLGKAAKLNLHRQQPRSRSFSRLMAATTLYGIAGLQLYVSANMVLPWLLPSLVIWAYVLPSILRKPHA